MTPALYWQRWSDAGLVGDAAFVVPGEGTEPSPWYIRLILGVCGWLGGLLLLTFIGFAWFTSVEAQGLGVLGLVLIAVAYAIYRQARSELGDQFALALSLAGQTLIAVSLYESERLTHGSALVAIGIMQLVLVWLMPNALHRALSMLFAMTAIDLAFYTWAYPSPVPVVTTWLTAMLWIDESRWQFRLGERFAPIASGLTLSALLGIAPIVLSDLHVFLQTEGRDVAGHVLTLYRVLPVLGALVWVWAVWRWTAQSAWRVRAPALILGAVMAVAGWWMPGVALGLLVLLLGHGRGKPALLGLGAAAGLVHLGWFYYALSTTLLVKSISLMALGAVLLIAAWCLPRLAQEVRDV